MFSFILYIFFRDRVSEEIMQNKASLHFPQINRGNYFSTNICLILLLDFLKRSLGKPYILYIYSETFARTFVFVSKIQIGKYLNFRAYILYLYIIIFTCAWIFVPWGWILSDMTTKKLQKSNRQRVPSLKCSGIIFVDCNHYSALLNTHPHNLIFKCHPATFSLLHHPVVMFL